MNTLQKNVRLWSESNLAPVSSLINRAAVFGSIAAGSECPNDCDLVLVSHKGQQTEAWRTLREYSKNLPHRFSQVFPFPLSLVLLTEPEWEELEDFFFPRILLAK